jgi:hypothetical protein
MNGKVDPVPRRARSALDLVVLAAVALLAAGSDLLGTTAQSQPAAEWTAPYQVTKLQWLALVVQAGRHDGLCRAPGCYLRTDYDVGNDSTMNMLFIHVDGFHATRAEVRDATIKELDRLRYAARSIFAMQAPLVHVSERATLPDRDLKFHNAVFNCVLPATKSARDADPEPLNFERSCTPVRRSRP